MTTKSRPAQSDSPKHRRKPLGRQTLDPDGHPRDVRLVVLLTAAEAEAFEAQAEAESTNPRALARKAIHAICPAISLR